MFAVGIGVLALVTSAAAFILYFHFKADIGAYQSTPTCAAPADALTMDCRYAGPAQVLGTSRTDQLRVTVRFPAMPGNTFTGRFPKNGEPSSSAIATGTTEEAELWSGKVSRLAGTPTSDNPESTPAESILPLGWFFLAGALVIFGLSAALARVKWRVQ
ncbi:MAG TPA: hypothetical protein VJR46_09285 [Candidatus Dormibacteraeota bacterium]|nr:hypothetical protein [Candidatus Dormibacteraeota bacterium]